MFTRFYFKNIIFSIQGRNQNKLQLKRQMNEISIEKEEMFLFYKPEAIS